LTEPIRRRPYQVILLDEFEKAHREVVRCMRLCISMYLYVFLCVSMCFDVFLYMHGMDVSL
jgi:hypothetical protein